MVYNDVIEQNRQTNKILILQQSCKWELCEYSRQKVIHAHDNYINSLIIVRCFIIDNKTMHLLTS